MSIVALAYCTVPNPIEGEAVSKRVYRALEYPSQMPVVTQQVCYDQFLGFCWEPTTNRVGTYYPADTSKSGVRRGVVLYIHGGGWQGNGGTGIAARDLLHPDAHRAPMVAWSASKKRTESDWVGGGWDVLSIDYRSASVTGNHFPGALHDIRVAMRFARANYIGFSKLPLVVMGHSAGAHLATLAALMPETFYPTMYPWHLQTTPARADGVVALAGPLDLEFWIAQIDWDNSAAPPESPVENYLRCSPDGKNTTLPPCLSFFMLPTVRAASPVTYAAINPVLPPIYAAYGADDHWVPGSAGCALGQAYYARNRKQYFWSDLIDDIGQATELSDTNHSVGGVSGPGLYKFLDNVANLAAGVDTFPTPNSNWPNSPTICN